MKCANEECRSTNIKIVKRGYCNNCYYRLKRSGKIRNLKKGETGKHTLSNINEKTSEGFCHKCKAVVKVQFKKGGRRYCGNSENARSRKWKRGKREIRKRMIGDSCDICGVTNKGAKLCWDHKHRSEDKKLESYEVSKDHFRGTLCNSCNLALGLFHDDIDRFYKAAKYLELFSRKS